MRAIQPTVRLLTLIACLAPLLSAQDANEIVRRAFDLDQKNADIALNYTYLQREVSSDLDSNGKPKNVEIRTFDVTLQEGSPYRRLVARNDQPLSPKEQQFEQEKLQNNIDQRRKETKEQRDRRIAEFNRRQERQREPIKDLPQVFNFHIVREEMLNGATTYVIDASPKPGYKPKTTSGNILSKMKGRLWIEKDGYHWVKVDMETLDTISFGAFLFRIAKGGHISIEQARVNNEVWLPRHLNLEASGKIVLIKSLHKALDMTFSDYKKFSAESRIVSTEPVSK